MTTISDERLAELARKASQNPHMQDETAAFRELQSLRGGVRVPSAEEIEQIICSTEPRSMTAAGDTAWTKRMAEALHARLSSLEASPAPVSDADLIEFLRQHHEKVGVTPALREAYQRYAAKGSDHD